MLLSLRGVVVVTCHSMKCRANERVVIIRTRRSRTQKKGFLLFLFAGAFVLSCSSIAHSFSIFV